MGDRERGYSLIVVGATLIGVAYSLVFVVALGILGQGLATAPWGMALIRHSDSNNFLQWAGAAISVLGFVLAGIELHKMRNAAEKVARAREHARLTAILEAIFNLIVIVSALRAHIQKNDHSATHAVGNLFKEAADIFSRRYEDEESYLKPNWKAVFTLEYLKLTNATATVSSSTGRRLWRTLDGLETSVRGLLHTQQAGIISEVDKEAGRWTP